jgi:hypothetical protein
VSSIDRVDAILSSGFFGIAPIYFVECLISGASKACDTETNASLPGNWKENMGWRDASPVFGIPSGRHKR